jgi:hypothetical protein
LRQSYWSSPYAVAAIVTGVLYAVEAPYFDHPYRGENASRNFVTGSAVLSALGGCVSFALFAPLALTSSALASRTGLSLGLGHHRRTPRDCGGPRHRTSRASD